MRKGAMIQFTNTLKAICTHIARWRKTWCSVSNLILHMMGYIITSNPTAIAPIQRSAPQTSSLPPNLTSTSLPGNRTDSTYQSGR